MFATQLVRVASRYPILRQVRKNLDHCPILIDEDLHPKLEILYCTDGLYTKATFEESCTQTSPSHCPLLQKAHLSTAATRLIVNAVGQDRVGIVSDVAGLVIKVGGNVGDSQAATLGSHFSLMMIVDVPSDRRDDLTATLHDLPDMNIAVFETKQTEPTFTPQIACTWSCSSVLSAPFFFRPFVVSFVLLLPYRLGLLYTGRC